MVDIIADYETTLEACQEIARLSAELWLLNDERTDDITIVILSIEDHLADEQVAG